MIGSTLPPTSVAPAVRIAESLSALTDAATAYWTRALTRGVTPLDVMVDHTRWLSAITSRRRPTWSTPNRVCWEAPVARLRDFSPNAPVDVVPTLVLPPQAGHDSCIVDFTPHQSQMRTIFAARLERVFTLDWIGASPATRDATINDYLSVIDRAVSDVGGRVNLIGDCQGGWLAAIYSALHPERVNTLTLAGAPIDFHAGEPVIGECLRMLAPRGDLAFYEALVRTGGGVLRGENMLAGFILIKPANELRKLGDLLVNLDDEQHVARFSEFEDWFKHTQDIPGAFYLWTVRELFRDNQLVEGTLRVGGDLVDLAAITCPLNLLGGASDHITPPAQVFAAADHVGTPAADVRRRVASGGHLGLFMGHEALTEHWPVLLAEVRERS